VASRLLTGEHDSDGLLAVDVRSSSRSYGRLAAFDPSGIRTYIPEERKILEAFASVAAAALEVATALDDSRRQAAIAEAMSELLDEERTLLSRIVESLPHGVSWTDSSGAIEGCNQALADLLDCQLSQIKGQRWADLCPDADMANRCTSWAEEVVSSCEPVINAEMPLTVGDERRVALVSVVPLSCGGSDERVLSIWADVTDQRSMEQRLAETSRLESIGQLAAGVAHEINTPMQYIGDNSAFLDKAFGLVTPLIDQLAELASVHGADQRAIDDLMSKAKLDLLRTRIPRANAQVAEGVTAVSRIVRSLKTFAHPGGDDLGPVDMAQVLDSTVTVARNEWKYAAHLDLDVAPDLPPVRAVPGMVNQVFLNLLVNAAHAVDERRAAEQTGQLGQITITCRALGDWVETQVSDDGGGIPDAVREKIYDQFFTTKGIGKGSGQGLAICRNIITRHEGTIDFTTSPQGTTFVVRLLLWHGSDGPSPID
jgi:signal transduction histidine kinase